MKKLLVEISKAAAGMLLILVLLFCGFVFSLFIEHWLIHFFPWSGH